MNHHTFWIDVGGTFTDCIGSNSSRIKVLSSGVTKGRVGPSSDGDLIVDSSRCADPDRFWNGFQLRMADKGGQTVATANVVESDASRGTLRLDQEILDESSVGLTYELAADLEAPILAIRFAMGIGLGHPLPPLSIRLGTTRGTNALLTRGGARTAFVTTKGFGDILLIGNQDRPKLFELSIRKPEPLFVEAIEIDERMAADGAVLEPPDEAEVREQLASLKQRGIESLGICLMHGYRYPEHERLVEQVAREIGFDEISVSSQVSPLIKIVARGDTTVVDAYLNPVLRSYLTSLRSRLHPETDLRLLTSAGGLVSAERFTGKDSVLSGPAGGVVGFSRIAEAAGFTRSIGFDMGGTSTDVSRYDGRYELQYETEKAGVRLVTPMMAIETVAAGGGSICHFDGTRLVVGPESAGADPGPACYGRGGPLAVTDVNLYLGKILPDHFPFQLDIQSVEQRLQGLCTEINTATGVTYTTTELAAGFLKVANTNMANAIRSVSVAKGYDPRDYTMVAFGGAAPQHACAVAEELGITTILNHPDNGVLSAYGIGLADVVRHQVAGIYEPLTDVTLESLEHVFDQLSNQAIQEIKDEGVSPSEINVAHFLQLRYKGTDASLTVPFSIKQDQQDFQKVICEFEQRHRRLYGYIQNRPLELVSARIEATGKSKSSIPKSTHAPPTPAHPTSHTQTIFNNQKLTTPIYPRTTLTPGTQIQGPAIITEQISTTLIDPTWQATTLTDHQLLITRSVSTHLSPILKNPVNPVKKPDPVQLEIFNNQFTAIATQMGITLQQTAASVNVKERLDFSCALFTPTGDLVVNAPHIPVHLGAMSETVKCIIADNPAMAPGDVYVTNDPFRGGSHLPDVTVVTPVFDASGGELLFITANRAHHAEIGGITPGSMPPFSKNLAEEGVLIRNFKVIDAGESHLDSLRNLIAGQGPTSVLYPSRNPDENIGDITAQIAANQQGARDLATLIDRYTYPVVRAYMDFIQQAAATKMREAIHHLWSQTSDEPRQTRTFKDEMDDGSVIAVTITLEADSMEIDFTGTASVHAGNLNANRAIVTAAVLYVMRCMINEDIPLNQGVLQPIKIRLPDCMLNPPSNDDPAQCAAMVGGNVETSQRVVDVLLGALGLAAASQGTMNNVLFGDDTFGYYETICGGSGATAEAPGADAVHTHMTNTRLTDPEVLEHRFPVQLTEFSIRQNSGGVGKHNGGNGVTRRLQFLQPVTVSLLTQRRTTAFPPFGLNGGAPATPGRNTHTQPDGQSTHLPPQTTFNPTPGDTLEIQTPGGGGYGKKS